MFLGNVAGTGIIGGGGIGVLGTLTLANCTLSGNVAGQGGGLSVGYLFSGLLLKMSSCTIYSNSCSYGYGGGLLVSNSAVEVQNSIIAGNSSPGLGHDVYVASVGSPGVLTSDGYNLIGATNDSSGWVATDLTGSTNAPLDPKLGPLQNNGGSTWTHALLSGSPAIDSGKSFGLTTDQRGMPRPVDIPYILNAAGGDGSDIGAFELNPPVLSIVQSGTNVVLSWSVNDSGYTLQFTPALNAPAWTTLPGTYAIVGSQFIVTNGPVTGNLFFRLKQ
jgi:hypothetical protein